MDHQRCGWASLACAAFLLAAGCEALDLGSEDSEGDAIDTGGSGQFVSMSDGPGGFVNNPDNSRGTLKLVFPVSYSGRITQVRAYTADGTYFDTLYRATPDEHDGRQRYYGTKRVGEYPDNLHIRVDLSDPQPDGTIKNSNFMFLIPDPQDRMD